MAHEAHNVPYSKVANAADLVSLTEDKRHIIKLHGDFDDDTSIVLDESSYFERLYFDSPLDIKRPMTLWVTPCCLLATASAISISACCFIA